MEAEKKSIFVAFSRIVYENVETIGYFRVNGRKT